MNSLSPCGGGVGKGGGRGGPLEGVGPENHIKLTTYSAEYRIQNTPAAKLVYIKFRCILVPVFYMALGLNDLMGANPLLGPLEGAGFLWLKWRSLRSLPFQGPKKSLPGATPSNWFFPYQNHYVPCYIL